MNSFTVDIWDDEGAKCTLYTVKWMDAEHSETDKFFLKSKNNANLKTYFQELAYFLAEIICKENGARSDYFRDERVADGLPPKGTINNNGVTLFCLNYPLRLYCLRIDNQTVVLFNGDEKTSGAAQDGKTSMSFYEAQEFANRILEAQKNNEFYFGQKDEIIIY